MLRLLWRRKSLPFGARGEVIAAKTLRRNGYRILDRNVQLGRNEIDIIAQEGDTVAFVEVKTRHENDIAQPEENVTIEKQRRLSRAANIYMDRANDPDMYYRFDVVSVVIPERGKPEVTIIRDAFEYRG